MATNGPGPAHSGKWNCCNLIPGPTSKDLSIDGWPCLLLDIS